MEVLKFWNSNKYELEKRNINGAVPMPLRTVKEAYDALLFKEKMMSADKPLGTFFNIGDLSTMEALGYSGLDFVIVDTEHGHYDTESMGDLISAAAKGGMEPLVRIAKRSNMSRGKRWIIRLLAIVLALVVVALILVDKALRRGQPIRGMPYTATITLSLPSRHLRRAALLSLSLRQAPPSSMVLRQTAAATSPPPSP